MKTKIGLFLFTMLAWTSVVFAAPGATGKTSKSYYNLSQKYVYGQMATSLLLTQSSISCLGQGAFGWGCVASVEATPEGLAEMLDTYWKNSLNFKGATLELGSDIDLGEFSSETEVGKCDVNHVPISVESSSFNGNGYTISHLCYYADTSMKEPVGFFGTVNRMTIQNVKLNGVRIYIDGKSSDGKDYYPVGALAGVVSFSSIDVVELANDSIQAPIAGGLAGLVKNATLSHIKGDDDIYVSNKVSIESGLAGSSDEQVQTITDHNVFLGGLVGVAIRSESANDSTFADDSVKVEVHDYATGHKSALGGIAGYFKTIGDTVENLQVFTKYKENGEVVSTKISGGSSMGGLFGVLHMYRSYGENGESSGTFIVKASNFDGKIYEAASPNVIALGGIIGRDTTESGLAVNVLNSLSSIEIKDSLTVSGKYQYFAGGVVGYGSSCGQGSNNGSEFLSVIESKTEGSITLSASGKVVEGLHSDAYLGGVIGSACLAQKKGLGLTNDTSSVVITSKVKTAVDENKVLNSTPVFDSVFVGGIIGFAAQAVNKVDTLSGLYYDGSIMVEDSLNNIFVGGVIGGFIKASGGKYLYLENVIAQNANLITYKAKETGAVNTGNNKHVTNIGGICGVCNDISGINFVGVSGVIKAMGTYAGDALSVGGLVGSATVNEVRTVVQNSYNIGNISVKMNNESGYDKKVGYLFGNALWNNGGRGFEIKSSYHFAKEDLSVEPFGVLSNNGSEITDWGVCDSIHYVIRNGAAREIKPAAKHQNGTELETTMTTAKFAGFLNKAYADAKDYAWSFKQGVNDNLPYFAEGEEKTDPTVDFVVTFVDRNNKTIKVDYVDEGGSAIAPTEEEMQAHEVEGYIFTGEWNNVFTNITADLTVMAEYVKKTYTVKFFSFDGAKQIGETQTIEYMDQATAPDAPTREGYEFAGWDDLSYMQVTANLNIKATYTPKKYLIVFNDYNGDELAKDSLAFESPVSGPVGFTRASTPAYTYTFKEWTPEVTVVKGDAIYTATYDSVKVKYEVVFLDYDESQIGDVQLVEYGSAAVAPADPVREGYLFKGWNRKFDNIVKSIDVMATYEKIPESSSSEPESSSSVEVSSSSEESSSSVEESSSSEYVEPESSSNEPQSSSSVRGEIKIVAPKIEQSGNAILLTFDTENADESSTARVMVKGENGVIVDTVISKSVVDGGQWEMTPAPMGKFSVTLVVGNDVQTAEYEGRFEVASEIKTAPGSWQMVSLSAFDNSSFKTNDATLYWWDEQNPVGDYWQYRAFTGGEAEATRGFWYGTTGGKPLVIRESTGSKDSEIVWELDNLYSGWNLVANPYGWFVDLKNGKSDNGAEVTFWQWDPVTAGYKIPTTIGPYEAVWAKVSKSTTWRMSAAPFYKIEERKAEKKALQKNANVKGAWNLTVALTDEYGKQDSWNVIGAGTAESLDEPPAGMGNRVSLAIREVLADGKKSAKLAKSIVPVADEYRWVLDVSASSMRDGKLKFEGVKELNGQGLKLFVEADGKSTELRDGQAYDVALAKSAKQVEVRVAASNAVVASKVGALRSTFAGETLQLGFDVPENLAGAKSSYAVVGVDGKVVASGNFTAKAGTNSIAAHTPKSGIYFVKVKVGSQQLSNKVLVR